MRLTGNTVLVTGGGSGIGRGIAEALHRLENKVVIAGRRKHALEEVTEANPGMHWIELDVMDASSIDRAAKTLIERYPDVNVLFNNAGIMLADNAAGVIDDMQLQSIVTTNLIGPIRLSGALVEHLKKQKEAAILYNTSVLAFTPFAMTAVYSSTKAALHSYALSQRYMLRDTSVRVVEVAPPWTQTDLFSSREEPRAMPLQAFLDETMAGLATGANEVIVERARRLRDNAGPNEHAYVTEFNNWLLGVS